MATRAQKIRLALFFLFSVSVLAGLLLTVVGGRFFRDRISYNIRFENVSVGNLNRGAGVHYLGTSIGRVENIFIDPRSITTVVVEISIAPEQMSAVTEETRASIGTLGITGLKFIVLSPGSKDARALPAGASIAGDETAFADIERKAEQITGKIEALLDRTNLLVDASNRENFAATLAATGALTENAEDILQLNRGHIDEVFANLAATAKSLANAAANMRTSTDSLRLMLTGKDTRNMLRNIGITAKHMRNTVEGPLPDLLKSLHQTSKNIDRTFVHVDQTVLQSRRNILNALQDLEETFQNFRETTEIIRDNPSVLIRGGSQTDGR